jgi:glycosyltransferase involved in cell wall biosynthesis
MASHNSAKYIQRALASVDNALKGRPYVLVMADDASTDDTVKIARNFPMRAEDRIIVSLPKSPSIGESKNRAVKLARPFLRKYPWVAFMDDDDEMLPGRFQTLLVNMEAEGQKAGISDWIYHPEWGGPSLTTGDWSLHAKMFAPGTTLIHRDLIPKNGDYFVAAPSDVHEDRVTHHRLTLSGNPICYHGGNPGHVYHQRNSSFTQGCERSTLMLKNSESYIARNFPETQTTIASFCTVAIGRSLPEAELLARSLRVSNNFQPVVVLTDADGASVVSGWGIAGVEAMVCDSAAYSAHFHDFATVYPGSSLNPGPFLGKMDVLKEAAKRHGTALYLDADMIVLRRFMDVIETPIGLAPELGRSCQTSAPSNWYLEQFGYFSGGYVYATKDATHIIDWWRREYLKSWRWFGSDSKPHGGFTDQSALNLIPLFGDVHVFHPGHNFMYTRVPSPTPTINSVADARELLRIHAGYGLFHRGWPVVTIHAHFRVFNSWSDGMMRALKQTLALSKDPVDAQIYALISNRS